MTSVKMNVYEIPHCSVYEHVIKNTADETDIRLNEEYHGKVPFHIADILGCVEHSQYLEKYEKNKIRIITIALEFDTMNIRNLAALRKYISNFGENTIVAIRHAVDKNNPDTQVNKIAEKLGFLNFNHFCGFENSTIYVYPNRIGLYVLDSADKLVNEDNEKHKPKEEQVNPISTSITNSETPRTPVGYVNRI